MKNKILAVISLLMVSLLCGCVLEEKNPFKKDENKVLEEKREVQKISKDKKTGFINVNDKKVWDYLDKETPKFEFNSNKPQTLIFKKEAKESLEGIKAGDTVNFPPVSKKILPYGITFDIKDVKEENNKLVLSVVENENNKIMTIEEVQKLLEEQNKNKQK